MVPRSARALAIKGIVSSPGDVEAGFLTFPTHVMLGRTALILRRSAASLSLESYLASPWKDFHAGASPGSS